MSSIFGKCNTDNKPITEAELKLMERELNYWKADGSNTWFTGPAGLGCLMLHNTPESLIENLPFHHPSYNLCITADARLDNREELYSLLQVSTPEEKKITDSAIILLLYKKYGADCVHHLVGDFAFAIWDGQEQKLFCARDHMGVKPFFYYRGDHFLAFATEKKGILCLPGIDRSIDKDFLCNELFRPVIQAGDTTIYKKIRRLLPAHTLTYFPVHNSLQLHRYWTLDVYKELTLPRREDYYEGLRYHFDNAVKCRLRTHYPIGAELSGGIDSSSITGAASNFLKSEGKGIITFTNTIDESDREYKTIIMENDRKYTSAVVEFNNIKDHTWITKEIWDNPLDEVDFAIKINDGLEMRSELWLLPIKKAAMQKNVRTLLSGFPGDEMVTYRGQLYFLDYFEHHKYIKYFKAKSEWPYNKLKPFLSPGLEFSLHKFKNRVNFKGGEFKKLFEFYKLPSSLRFNKGDVVWQDVEYRERFKSYRHYQKYRLLKPQVPLRMEGENRFGLTFRTESRYPMADIRLTQFYLSMPNDIKYEGPISRSAFRKAVQPYLPDIILQRDSKLGHIAAFRVPAKSKGYNQDMLLKLLNEDKNAYFYRNKNLLNIAENTHTRAGSIELLRWFKNNFESL